MAKPTQRRSFTDAWTDADWAFYEEQIDAEDAAWAAIGAWADALPPDAAALCWRWGDGYGGAILERVTEAAERAGFPRQARALGPTGPTLSAAVRREVMERDAYRCRDCGGWRDLAIDHVVPRSAGGTDHLANLQTLCRSCNSSKGARLP